MPIRRKYFPRMGCKDMNKFPFIKIFSKVDTPGYTGGIPFPKTQTPVLRPFRNMFQYRFQEIPALPREFDTFHGLN